MGLLIFLYIFLTVILVALVFMINGLYGIVRTRVPYVPTAQWAVEWLQEHLDLPAGSIVYDLGCGDARVLAAMANHHPDVKFIGIEVQWWPTVLAKLRARSIPNLRIERIDFWSRPIADATHVFCYIFQPILAKMKTKFETELRPGTIVISFGFHIPGWATTKEISNPSGKTKSRILFYQR